MNINSGITTIVFDAYGTLFDVHSVEATAEELYSGLRRVHQSDVAPEADPVHVVAHPDGQIRRLRRCDRSIISLHL